MAKRKTKTKRTTGKRSGTKVKGSSKPGYDFIIRRLEKDKNASYADIAKAAKCAGHTVYPIMFGRAKAALGLVKVSARGKGKASVAKATAVRRGPGRPRKASASSNGSALTSVIQSMRDQESESNRLKTTLEKIRALLDGAL